MARKPAPAAPDAPTVHVMLLQPHTHAGMDCAPGDTLTLRPPQAARLIDLGVAQPATPDTH